MAWLANRSAPLFHPSSVGRPRRRVFDAHEQICDRAFLPRTGLRALTVTRARLWRESACCPPVRHRGTLGPRARKGATHGGATGKGANKGAAKDTHVPQVVCSGGEEGYRVRALAAGEHTPRAPSRKLPEQLCGGACKEAAAWHHMVWHAGRWCNRGCPT